MPSTATITAYYSFTGGTKARASQVQNNFDVSRGHRIPIDPNTQTGSNLSYDLGSTEYQWRSAYVGGYTITNETTTGLGGLKFSLGGTEKFRIASSFGNTLTAGAGQYAIADISGTFTGPSLSTITGSTLTITTIGRPIMIGLTSNTTASAMFTAVKRIIADGTNNTATLRYVVDGAVFASQVIGTDENRVTGNSEYQTLSPVLRPLAAGAHTISLTIQPAGANVQVVFFAAGFYAMET